jgi:thiol-disulfide isomerase/thioredoxin
VLKHTLHLGTGGQAMFRFIVASSLVIAIGLASFAPAAENARTADQIMADYKAVALPQPDMSKRGNQAYIQEYLKQRTAAMQKRADLALELYKAQPDHPSVAAMMFERWSTLAQRGAYDTIIAETQPIAGGATPFAKNAAYMLASAQCSKAKWAYEPSLKAIDAFEANAPGDERAASLLARLAMGAGVTAEQSAAISARIVEKYPNSQAAASAKGKIRQAQGIGKPFEFSFKDAITGRQIDSAGLKGKVLVIDFWATWCGPCIAEMPKMKKLYAEFKDKGVEFIGISLDQPEAQGGLKRLKDYVEKNEIGWPQYYQGNYWNSEFSRSWGINAIPCVFVVDQDGNLYSTTARGKLETMIPELLKKGQKP